ncbi:MAG: cyclopropane fatty acyl phospholipid synthase [Desulfobacterales bacterium SG8_35]|nr:MAG: cyclopropane fatty acyl phospholipid synthase [Desulfobacterales bacterium SG8_35]
MDGWWDAAQVDEFFSRALKANLQNKILSLQDFFCYLQALILNLQCQKRSYAVGKKHYDIGNDLYECMLDKRMIYSCAFWKNVESLDQAQEAKLDMVCRKLELKPGMRVLDIGCGWGGMAEFAAQNYGVEVLGITISREQAALARQRCAGLPVKIRLQDYRNLNDTFDRVLSLGMFEHVGYKNYRTFMEKVCRLLKDDGLFLLHTIGSNRSQKNTDSWIQKYIFPNSMLPSAKQISAAIEGVFVLEDWHAFGADYDKTLMHWYENFKNSWHSLRKEYDERFFRMWKYYLLSCAGSFRARANQLWQIVLSPRGIPGGYRAHYK